MTSPIGPSQWRPSYDVLVTSQYDLRRPDLYENQMRRRYDVACRVGSAFSFLPYQ